MGTSQVSELMSAINETCRESGSPYTDYSCKPVSWDDAQRGGVGTSLSCWGGNITDTRLWAKDGTQLFTVRPGNWNEKLGKVSADEITLRIGNHIVETKSEMKSISLERLLKNLGEYGSYAMFPHHTDFYDPNLDKEISIRFQTTFLPVPDELLAKTEFASEAYNYNTRSDDDPKNILLLCTTQGTAVQQDGVGAKKLFHHRLDRDNVIHRHWLEAERTDHDVGGPQIETAAEREDAIARGKATAELIGLQSMESRFNVLMTVQIPLEQSKTNMRGCLMADCVDGGGYDNLKTYSLLKLNPKKKSKGFMPGGIKMFAASATDNSSRRMRKEFAAIEKQIGKSNAARVSRGTEHDMWPGLTVLTPKRHPAEHVTVTVVLYNTVAGGVPAPDDVIAAIDDMEALYDSCPWTGRLADDGAQFMKKELTADEMAKIRDKIVNQPPQMM